jgi:hypothetical protein
MPTPDPDHSWPSCDDQPGVSIRPLRQADLAALLAHLDQRHQHGQDPADNAAGPGGPVLAVRVRASIGQAGASAHARYRRRRAIEWAAWTPQPALAGRRHPGRRARRGAGGRPAAPTAGRADGAAGRRLPGLGTALPGLR